MRVTWPSWLPWVDAVWWVLLRRNRGSGYVPRREDDLRLLDAAGGGVAAILHCRLGEVGWVRQSHAAAQPGKPSRVATTRRLGAPQPFRGVSRFCRRSDRGGIGARSAEQDRSSRRHFRAFAA